MRYSIKKITMRNVRKLDKTIKLPELQKNKIGVYNVNDKELWDEIDKIDDIIDPKKEIFITPDIMPEAEQIAKRLFIRIKKVYEEKIQNKNNFIIFAQVKNPLINKELIFLIYKK